MTDLIIYLTAVLGMVILTNKSKFFKPLRFWIGYKSEKYPNSNFWWFLNSILGCMMCMSVWIGGLATIAVLFLPLWQILFYPYCAVAFVTVIGDVWELAKRS